MKVTLLVVGKTTDVHIETLIQEYQKRLAHYIPFALQVIPELKNTKALTAEHQQQHRTSPECLFLRQQPTEVHLQ